MIFDDLNLPAYGWCVVGGAMMEAFEIRKNANDVDLLVDSGVFDQLIDAGWVASDGGSGGNGVVYHPVFTWVEALEAASFEDVPNIYSYIFAALIRDGVPYITPEHMLEWKLIAAREKDLADADLLKAWIAANRVITEKV